MKHAKAPWVICGVNNEFLKSGNGNGKLLLQFWNGSSDADANLIAAAPDLLRALEACLAWSDELQDKVYSDPKPDTLAALVRDAICKATNSSFAGYKKP